MFHVVANHWELILYNLTNPNFELGKVEKAMFLGISCHIFGLLTIPKCDLSEFEKSFSGY